MYTTIEINELNTPHKTAVKTFKYWISAFLYALIFDLKIEKNYY